MTSSLSARSRPLLQTNTDCMVSSATHYERGHTESQVDRRLIDPDDFPGGLRASHLSTTTSSLVLTSSPQTMSSIYEDTFANVRNPPAVFTAVTDRIRLQEAFTEDLAAYYHERAAVEEAYVKSLQKLSGRLHDGGSSTVFSAVAGLGLDRNEQKQQLGAWATIRTTLEREVIDTARVHDGWRTKITSEVTEPLRKSLNKAQWSSWQQAEAQLESTVKEYDSTLDKVQKVSLTAWLVVEVGRPTDARRSRHFSSRTRPSRPNPTRQSCSITNLSCRLSARLSRRHSPPSSASLKLSKKRTRLF